jgi:endogenous inhibitor of DNA gyrase (YacG/DUF329 family)
MVEMITLLCTNCAAPFERSKSGWAKSNRYGKKEPFCSQYCAGRYRAKHWNETLLSTG